MDSYALALQRALVSALSRDVEITLAVQDRVYDQPTHQPKRPFIRLGEILPRPLRSDGKQAARILFSVQAHTRHEDDVTSAEVTGLLGRTEATRIAECIVAVLDEPESFDVEGFSVTRQQWLTTRVEQDPDGKGHTAVVAFETTLDG